METQLLRDPLVPPTPGVLKKELGTAYPTYEMLINSITSPEYGLAHEWRYYKDGKAWLCKVTDPKKTIFWMSAWSGYFQVGIYFMERHFKEIDSLDIDRKIKEDFFQIKSTGKLHPITFRISQKEQLKDLLTVIALKMSVK